MDIKNNYAYTNKKFKPNSNFRSKLFFIILMLEVLEYQ